MDHFLSVIIPCYNEEEVIEKTYERIKAVMDQNNYSRHELIFINDGSKDKTLSLLEKIAGQDSRVKIISFSRNFGHQAAVTAGINNCSGGLAIIIDADLQDPPEIFPDMLEIYHKENCNIVYGVRKKRKKEGLFKKLTAKIYYRLINYLSGLNFPVDTGDFRLIDHKVIHEFQNLNERNKYIRGLISWMGFKQCPIYYDRDPRAFGETKYTLSKMLKLAKIGIFYFSNKPLKLSITLGLTSIIISLILTIYVFFSKFYWSATLPGWASTLITIVFFGGVQLFIIGILGEYIGIIFEEVKKRPEYIIDKTTNLNDKKEGHQ